MEKSAIPLRKLGKLEQIVYSNPIVEQPYLGAGLFLKQHLANGDPAEARAILCEVVDLLLRTDRMLSVVVLDNDTTGPRFGGLTQSIDPNECIEIVKHNTLPSEEDTRIDNFIKKKLCACPDRTITSKPMWKLILSQGDRDKGVPDILGFSNSHAILDGRSTWKFIGYGLKYLDYVVARRNGEQAPFDLNLPDFAKLAHETYIPPSIDDYYKLQSSISRTFQKFFTHLLWPTLSTNARKALGYYESPYFADGTNGVIPHNTPTRSITFNLTSLYTAVKGAPIDSKLTVQAVLYSLMAAAMLKSSDYFRTLTQKGLQQEPTPYPCNGSMDTYAISLVGHEGPKDYKFGNYFSFGEYYSNINHSSNFWEIAADYLQDLNSPSSRQEALENIPLVHSMTNLTKYTKNANRSRMLKAPGRASFMLTNVGPLFSEKDVSERVGKASETSEIFGGFDTLTTQVICGMCVSSLTKSTDPCCRFLWWPNVASDDWVEYFIGRLKLGAERLAKNANNPDPNLSLFEAVSD